MKRFVFGLWSLAVGLAGGEATAQAQIKAEVGGKAEVSTEGASATASGSAEGGANKAPAAGDGTDLAGAVSSTDKPDQPGAAAKRSWDDVVVVPRKAFLRDGRLELAPFTGVSLNDVLIRHYSFGGDLNYFITDVFSLGLQGQYYIKERTDRETLAGLQYNVVPKLNKYKWSAALNFGYVPGYGKFTMFNRYIIHWDMLVSGGVGMIQTEIIPERAGDESFTNNRIAPNVGVGTRLVLGNWLTFNVSLRDYIFNDLFEPTNRGREDDIETVKANAESQWVHNVMLYAGIGLYLPTSFSYKTPR